MPQVPLDPEIPIEAMPQDGKRGCKSYTIRSPGGAVVEVLLVGRGAYKIKKLGEKSTMKSEDFNGKRGHYMPWFPNGPAAVWDATRALCGW